jgi:hypothetical protein
VAAAAAVNLAAVVNHQALTWQLQHLHLLSHAETARLMFLFQTLLSKT